MTYIRLLVISVIFTSGAFAQEPGSKKDDMTLLKDQYENVNLPKVEKIPSQPVKFEAGKTNFVQGDSIKITSIRGSSSGINTNETYKIDGFYTLNSHDEAMLSAFVTTNENGGRSTIDLKQTKKVSKGKGKFSLILTMHNKGYPHVSFYPRLGGESFGGVYFGTGDSVLRDH